MFISMTGQWDINTEINGLDSSVILTRLDKYSLLKSVK